MTGFARWLIDDRGWVMICRTTGYLLKTIFASFVATVVLLIALNISLADIGQWWISTIAAVISVTWAAIDNYLDRLFYHLT